VTWTPSVTPPARWSSAGDGARGEPGSTRRLGLRPAAQTLPGGVWPSSSGMSGDLRALQVRGLCNVQFAVKDDGPTCWSQPRAADRALLARPPACPSPWWPPGHGGATSRAAGRGLLVEPVGGHVSVKERSSFQPLPGVDTLLGPRCARPVRSWASAPPSAGLRQEPDRRRQPAADVGTVFFSLADRTSRRTRGARASPTSLRPGGDVGHRAMLAEEASTSHVVAKVGRTSGKVDAVELIAGQGPTGGQHAARPRPAADGSTSGRRHGASGACSPRWPRPSRAPASRLAATASVRSLQEYTRDDR